MSFDTRDGAQERLDSFAKESEAEAQEALESERPSFFKEETYKSLDTLKEEMEISDMHRYNSYDSLEERSLEDVGSIDRLNWDSVEGQAPDIPMGQEGEDQMGMPFEPYQDRGPDSLLDLDDHPSLEWDPHKVQTLQKKRNLPKLRFEVVLDSGTAISQSASEEPLTYLNRGQKYSVAFTDSEHADEMFMTNLCICFHETKFFQEEEFSWREWISHQAVSSTRPLEFDPKGSSGVTPVESPLFNSIQFSWNGKQGAKVAIRFNCMSTDFLKVKGARGIELRLQTQTQDSNGFIENSYCRIKVFREKGAERKNRDEQKVLEKRVEKIIRENPQAKIVLQPPSPRTHFVAIFNPELGLGSGAMSSLASSSSPSLLPPSLPPGAYQALRPHPVPKDVSRPRPYSLPNLTSLTILPHPPASVPAPTVPSNLVSTSSAALGSASAPSGSSSVVTSASSPSLLTSKSSDSATASPLSASTPSSPLPPHAPHIPSPLHPHPYSHPAQPPLAHFHGHAHPHAIHGHTHSHTHPHHHHSHHPHLAHPYLHSHSHSHLHPHPHPHPHAHSHSHASHTAHPAHGAHASHAIPIRTNHSRSSSLSSTHSPPSEEYSPGSSNSSRCASPTGSRYPAEAEHPFTHGTNSSDELNSDPELDQGILMKKKRRTPKAEKDKTLCLLLKTAEEKVYTALYLTRGHPPSDPLGVGGSSAVEGAQSSSNPGSSTNLAPSSSAASPLVGKQTQGPAEELKQEIAKRYNLDINQISGMCRVSKKGLSVRVDDAVVEHFENESDFVLEFVWDTDDQTVTVLLR